MANKILTSLENKKYIITYDCNPIIKELYSTLDYIEYYLNYSAQNKTRGIEYMFFSKNLKKGRVEKFLKVKKAEEVPIWTGILLSFYGIKVLWQIVLVNNFGSILNVGVLKQFKVKIKACILQFLSYLNCAKQAKKRRSVRMDNNIKIPGLEDLIIKNVT